MYCKNLFIVVFIATSECLQNVFQRTDDVNTTRCDCACKSSPRNIKLSIFCGEINVIGRVMSAPGQS